MIKESFKNPESGLEEDRKIVEATKEAVVKLGLFDKQFVDSLNYRFLDADTGTLDESAGDDPRRDVYIPPQSMMEFSLERNWWGDRSPVTRIPYIWSGREDIPNQKKIHAFDAVVAHEIAHPESFRIFSPDDGTFPSEAFRKNVISMNKAGLGDTPGLDFNRFEFSAYEWSEIYAFLYQREYLRRSSDEGEEIIRSADSRTLRVAQNLKKEAERISQEFQMQIDPDLIYQDIHVLARLLAGIIEKEHPGFRERMKYVESLGTPPKETYGTKR